jgi:predicted TIM-barrel fold metal-dependent hydrolase
MQGLGALGILGPVAAGRLALAAQSDLPKRIFDAHCHIIDPHYPLVANEGYLPPAFPLSAYLERARPLHVTAGAVVSGSFQGFDQTYLLAVLQQLGPSWVGVTQVPADIPDAEIARLTAGRVRALRFNMFRGRIDSVVDVVSLAARAHAVGGWHAEIYADAAALRPHVAALSKLPDLVIDHLGMTEAGLPVILDLVDAGARVKATGFGRVQMDVGRALERISQRNPNALMFGTDMPSTRAKRPFEVADIALVQKVLGPELAERAFWANAVAVYGPKV